MPLVSVLMTVYNRERFLASAVASVLAQTFRDFELIIVDDRSTDRSVELARPFECDPQVRIHVNEHNLGDYPNRNCAASLARGKYLKYVDSDDVIYPHSLALMVEALEAHPAAALALSHSAPEDEKPYPWELSPREAWRKQFLGRGCLSGGPSAAIVRRDAFDSVGGFGNWGVLGDMELWLRMTARWPVVLLPPGLIWWRRHEQQEFTKDSAAITYLERGFALTREKLSSPECPLAEPERQRALARAQQNHARRLLSLASRGGHPLLAGRLFRNSGLSLRSLLSGFRRYR